MALGYTWGGVILLFFCVSNGQVLLENVRTRFEPNCATLLGGQNGLFWPENSVFELLGPLVPPKSALGGPILLAHENSGHKQPRITRVRFLGQKKLSRAF